MPKVRRTRNVTIKLTDAEFDRLLRAAAHDDLGHCTWARLVVMRKVRSGEQAQ